MRKSKHSRIDSHKGAPTTEENLYIQDKTSNFNPDVSVCLFYAGNFSDFFFLITFRDMGYLGKAIMGIFPC